MKICVDAGHGPGNTKPGVYDSGAKAAGVEEARVTLDYAMAMRDALLAAGFNVFMTREWRGPDAPVGQRAQRAKTAGCDAFVSWHLNSSGDPKSNGLEVLYRGSSPKSEALAGDMQKRLVAVTGFRNRGTGTDFEKSGKRLAVLKFDGPAVLIELGFVSNQFERIAVQKDEFRLQVARAAAQVVASFFGVKIPQTVLDGWAAPTLPAHREPPAPAPSTTSVDRLGAIAKLVRSSPAMRPQLAGLQTMCRLPGALYFESDLDLDTDGEEEPGITYEPTHQRGLSIGGGVNSNRVPYVVLPIGFAKEHGLRMGDVAAVLYRDRIEYAVLADQGPRQKIGEGSIALHRALGFERVKNGRIVDVGIPGGVITILFQNSGNGTPQTPDKIREVGRKRFAALGGKP